MDKAILNSCGVWGRCKLSKGSGMVVGETNSGGLGQMVCLSKILGGLASLSPPAALLIYAKGPYFFFYEGGHCFPEF